MAELDLGDENSWGLRSSTIIQMQPSVEHPLLIPGEERKTVSFQARTMLIVLDKKKMDKERKTTEKKHDSS